MTPMSPNEDRPPLDPLTDYRVTPGMGAAELVDAMYEAGGFSAKRLAVAAEIVNHLVREDVTTILSFPAALMATGMRGVLRGMVQDGWVDAIITTCGTLDHDLARVWEPYHHGSFGLDDRELHQLGVHRLGNVLVPQSSYGEVLEEHVRPWIDDLVAERRAWSTADLTRELGERVRDEEGSDTSLLAACASQDVPVIVPGITDGAVGSQIWLQGQGGEGMLFDLLKDEQLLSDLVFEAEELGAVMVGGGISKHHVIWWSQFRDGLDYGVYITTAPEWDGSLSGARLEEAISWGKVKEEARIVNIPGDATLILPLVYAAALGEG